MEHHILPQNLNMKLLKKAAGVSNNIILFEGIPYYPIMYDSCDSLDTIILFRAKNDDVLQLPHYYFKAYSIITECCINKRNLTAEEMKELNNTYEIMKARQIND